MHAVTIELSDAEARALKRRTGKRTVSAAVANWLERGIEAEAEPLTPAQCRDTMRGGSKIKITPKMSKLGLDAAFFA